LRTRKLHRCRRYTDDAAGNTDAETIEADVYTTVAHITLQQSPPADQATRYTQSLTTSAKNDLRESRQGNQATQKVPA